ncbi:MAG: hypothetical protein FWD96_05515 [Defluviitaleaceae bacterium]|nr:hypothetical protein [Defluviitaleaceae bacterium]
MENRKVVLLNGNTTSWFDQAIIIVKDGHKSEDFEGGKPSPNLIAQAEKIVNGCNPFKIYTQNFAYKADDVGSKPPSTTHKPTGTETGIHVPGKKNAKKDSFDIYLNAIMIISCIALAGVLITQI